MNAGRLILLVASERRDAQNERDGAGLRSSIAAATPSQLRRSSVAAALQPSTQLVAFLLEVLRCCQQHLEEGRGGTSRGDARCALFRIPYWSRLGVVKIVGREPLTFAKVDNGVTKSCQSFTGKAEKTQFCFWPEIFL